MTRLILGTAAAIALGLLFASVLLIFTLAAYQMLATLVPAGTAMALSAVFLAALMAGTAAAAMALRQRQRGQPLSDMDPLDAAALQAGRELSELVRAHPYLSNAGSLVAGFAIGASPPLREALLRTLLGGGRRRA